MDQVFILDIMDLAHITHILLLDITHTIITTVIMGITACITTTMGIIITPIINTVKIAILLLDQEDL